ncbi:MAG: PEP-CTERM sorting domain-containing protein [Phycisphaeraceae bacterium]
MPALFTRTSAAGLLAAAALALPATNATAATMQWSSPTDGSFNDDANWDAATPGSGDVAHFGTAHQYGWSYDVNFPDNGALSNHQLRVDATATTGDTLDVDLDLRGGTYTLTSTGRWDDASVLVGNSDDDPAILSVRNGSLVGHNGVIGRGSGTSGEVNLDDATWDNEDDLTVGSAGQGTLNVHSGSSVVSEGAVVGWSNNSVGRVLVSGNDATFTSYEDYNTRLSLGLGSGSSGELVVRNGGTANARSVDLGSDDGAQGNLLVEGEDSSFHSSSVALGGISGSNGDPGGTGTATVRHGASAEMGEVLLYGGGSLTVDRGRLSVWRLDFAEPGAEFTFTTGELEIRERDLIADDRLLDRTIGSAHRLGVGRTLAFADSASLVAPLIVDGGTFSVEEFQGGELVDFRTGTMRFTDRNTSLQIGSGQVLGATVRLAADQRIESAEDARVASDGLLLVEDGGSFHSGQNLYNQGEIQLAGTTARVDANTLTLNSGGLLLGSGRVSAALTAADGEVRAGAGQRLVFTGSDNTNSAAIAAAGGRIDFTRDLTSDGEISVVGGTLKIGGAAVNEAGGAIGGSDASLRFDGGLTNHGQLALSAGTSEVYGTVNNTADGRIALGGGSTTSFFGNLDNEGTMLVLDGATAVLMGDVSGSGAFAGDGAIEFLGNFSPGSSPGISEIGNDVTYHSISSILLELGGTTPGDEHDKIIYTGDVTLDDPALDVVLYDGFAPDMGDVFDVFDFGGSLTGEFGAVNLPTLAQGLNWDTSELYTAGTLSVVPEPTSLVLLGLGGMMLIRCRPR